MPVDEDLFEEEALRFLIAQAASEALTLGLSDSLGASVVHINSSIPRKLILSIANTLTTEVRIVGQSGQPTKSNFHFHLQFLDTQCFFNSPPVTVTTPGWTMMFLSDPTSDYITDIYLLSTATIILAPANSAGSTTEVALRYTEALLSNPTDEGLKVGVTVGSNVFIWLKNPQPVTDTETVHLTTFTDAGAPTPLIATLVQPRTVLDDGTTPASLLLRLVNTSPDPVAFAPPPEADSPTPTAIELSVDVHGTAAWALCTSGEADVIEIVPPPNWTPDTASVVPGQKTWLFRPNYSKTTQIAPNSALEFQFKAITTSLPPGFTNLYVRLQEFPNYGTQTAVSQIEKSPLIYNPCPNSGMVSNGTKGTNQGLTLNGDSTGDLLQVNQAGQGNNAHFKGGAGAWIENGLALSGDTSTDLLLVNQAGAGNSAHFKGGAGVNIENGLEVSGDASITGDVRINDHTIWFRQGSDQNHGIGWYGVNKPFAGANVDGPVVFGFEGGALGSTNGGQKIALAWNKNGRVGIGTHNPQSKLEVKGGGIQLDGDQQIVFTNEGETNQLKLQLWGGFGLGINSDTLFYAGNVHSWRDATISNEMMNLSSAGLNVKGTGASTFAGTLGVGITPTRASFEIKGYGPGIPLSFGYMTYNYYEYATTAGGGGVSLSMYASNYIAAQAVCAFSDERIKRIAGRSDAVSDLSTLMGIEVTDYSYIDSLLNGTNTHKKVIGQQVLKVFPQAVSTATDVVPDIYQKAAICDGWVQLTTDLKRGDRVRLIGPKNEGIHEVLEVAEGQFRTDFATEGSEVFVYGREVNDFLSVDYDAIAMLNVSATQQIKREKDAEVEALRQENAALRARLDRLETLMERLVLSDAYNIRNGDDSEEDSLVKQLN